MTLLTSLYMLICSSKHIIIIIIIINIENWIIRTESSKEHNLFKI